MTNQLIKLYTCILKDGYKVMKCYKIGDSVCVKVRKLGSVWTVRLTPKRNNALRWYSLTSGV